MPGIHARPRIRRWRGDRQRGMSLVEIMVGIAIGLVAMVVILQTLSLWESQRRTTTAGADAQINGGIAMYELDRDLKLAGLGFGTATSAQLGCTVNAYHSDRGGAFTFPLLPVQITSDAEGGKDTLAVLYGNPHQLVSDVAFTGATASTKVSASNSGFSVGEVMLVTNAATPAACDLVAVSALDTTTDYKTLTHMGGSWNRSEGTVGSYSSGFLYDLGTAPVRHVWSVDSSLRLSWFDDLTTADSATARASSASQVAEQIISLKAQYGVSSGATTGVVDSWTTVLPADPTTVRAVRVALLARSRQYERLLHADGSCCVDATAEVPTWSGSGTGATDAPFVVTHLDGSASGSVPDSDVDNWHRYRYRVFEAVVPLRNVIWGATQ